MRSTPGSPRSHRGGRVHRNGWPLWRGIAGRNHVEQVATLRGMRNASEEETLKALSQEIMAFQNGIIIQSTQPQQEGWAVLIPYYASDNNWGTGIAIKCGSTSNLEFTIAITDTDGNTAAVGTFELNKLGHQKVDLLQNFFGGAAIPARGSIGIFSTGYFYTTMFMMNNLGGFGFVDKQAIRYE
jgi:hypothetical protein